jgi:hypothetical protein
MAGKYTGFDRLKSTLAKRPGVKDPAALSAAIGKKKYSAKRFQQHAARGESFRPKT